MGRLIPGATRSDIQSGRLTRLVLQGPGVAWLSRYSREISPKRSLSSATMLAMLRRPSMRSSQVASFG